MWFSKKVEEVKEVVEPSPTKKELKQQVEKLEAELKAYKEWWAKMLDDARDSEIVLDFEALNVFSIERMIKSNETIPCTIIGYLKEETTINDEGKVITNNGVKEWYYYCSDKRHQELVDKFKELKK